MSDEHEDVPTVEHDEEVRAAEERDRLAETIRVDATVGERIYRAVTGVNVRVTFLALFLSMAVGAVVIALSDDQARSALGYVTARPGDFLAYAWDAITDAYIALFRGSLSGWRPLSETGVAAIPLILTGLAVTVPLRAGMFNIGGEGQLIAGGLLAGYVGFAIEGLPLLVHLPLAVLAGIVGGALYGLIPGILKARTGAHEVISTIMLNNIALYVTTYAVSSSLFRAPGRADPISKEILASARFPRFSPSLRIHVGLILVLLVAVAIFFLVERSTFGFELNAVGLNPFAATTAGMSVTKMTVLGLVVAGALAGLGGAAEILGVQHRLVDSFSRGLGFDGITVALLGRGQVGGTVAAGFLFGALEAGGRAMQAQSGTALDLVTVIQALIIVFIAAPALVRALFRIRTQSSDAVQVSTGWGA